MEMLKIFHITPNYAAILGLIYVALSLNVVRNRWKFKTGIGTGGHRPLDKSIRVHGNFAEYVPFTLLLMAMTEILGANNVTLHIIGVAIVLGRILHAIGLTKSIGTSLPRMGGMTLTFASLIIASLSILIR